MRSDLLSQDRSRGHDHYISARYMLPWSKNRGENMEETIKDLSIEELKQIVKMAQKEIDRRTIKKVDDRN